CLPRCSLLRRRGLRVVGVLEYVYPLDLGSKAGGDGEADAVLVGEDGPAVGDGEGEVGGVDEDVLAALLARVSDLVGGHGHWVPGGRGGLLRAASVRAVGWRVAPRCLRATPSAGGRARTRLAAAYGRRSWP